MNEVNQNKPVSIHGVLTDIRSIPTERGTAFVVCKVDAHKCKLFGDLAKCILANQDQYEGQEKEAYGHWDVKRRNEFVIDGFGKQPVQSTPKPTSDNRPERPAMEVRENYIVITIPQGATPEQVHRITGVAKEAVRGLETQLGGGISELTAVHVMTSHPADQIGDIEF
jgi:hypothetical protein